MNDQSVQAAFYAYNFHPMLLVLLGTALFVLLVLLMSGGGSGVKQKLTRVEERICRACHTTHPPFANFCRRCGKKLQDG